MIKPLIHAHYFCSHQSAKACRARHIKSTVNTAHILLSTCSNMLDGVLIRTIKTATGTRSVVYDKDAHHLIPIAFLERITQARTSNESVAVSHIEA